jgi:hypothetical protein
MNVRCRLEHSSPKKLQGDIFITFAELRPREDAKSQRKCLDSNSTAHSKIFIFIAALARKQHIETDA